MTLKDELINANLPIVKTWVNEFGKVEAAFERELTQAEWEKYLQIAEPDRYAKLTEIVFSLPVRAPDFFVSSPKPKDDPMEAMDEAVAEAGKANKSIALIALSFVKYLPHIEKRMKKGKL